MARNIKIEINDPNVIREVLQEAYVHANEQIVQSQNEINKLANATSLQDEPIEGKSKYAKAINDYLGIKDKAITKKIEIAKLLSEIQKHNGDVAGALASAESEGGGFDFNEIKKMVDDTLQQKDKKKVIDIRK